MKSDGVGWHTPVVFGAGALLADSGTTGTPVVNR
jgi:hypothetical protein